MATTDGSPQKTARASGATAARTRPHKSRISVPPDALRKFNGRVLDPGTAVRIPGQAPIESTAYVADRLIVSGKATDATLQALADAALKYGLRVVSLRDAVCRAHDLARRAGFDNKAMYFSYPVKLVPAGDGPAAPADAWPVLQQFRAALGKKDPALKHVALDHLIGATMPDIGGAPEVGGHGIGGAPEVGGHGTTGVPEVGGHGVDRPSDMFGIPGLGGRAPVMWTGLAPARRDTLPFRRPVVAVLDTGVGKHPWLAKKIVNPDAEVLGVPIGIHDPATDPDRTGVIDDPYEGILDPDSGHGTFIAGLIRQKCPDANVLAIRVMGSDGVVLESMLLDALKLLTIRQLVAQAAGDASQLVDVVSLSLGYYHELPDDASYDPLILEPLRALSAAGVAVVASAGNNSTSRPMYPAAFAPHPGGRYKQTERNFVPLISVGALNPDGSSSLFSNEGSWVLARRPGAAVVSTFPTTFNGSEQAAFRFRMAGAGVRSTIDPDNFRSGFGTWSGTSFAAPILAGEIAQWLAGGTCGDLDACDAKSSVARAWAALGKTVKSMVRP